VEAATHLERPLAQRATRVLAEVVGRSPPDVAAALALTGVVRGGRNEALAPAVEAFDDVRVHAFHVGSEPLVVRPWVE
jgi:hypothetical protein